MGKKVIALDLGRVCVTLRPERVLRKVGLAAAFRPPAELDTLCRDVECGRLDTPEFLRRVNALFGNRFPEAELPALWNLHIGETMPGMAEAATELRSRGYELAFFSNTGALHLARVREICSFVPLVSGGVYSFEVGAMKPDAAIYAAFEKKYGVPFAFFDDRRENIEAACARGWDAFVFRSPRKLLAAVRALEERGKG